MKRFTSWNFPVVEAGIADPNGGETPAPLWDWPGLWGAGITESLSAGTTVVLGVIGLKLFPTFMTLLQSLRRHVFTLPWSNTTWMLFCLLSALVTYQDKGVRFPVGRSDLVGKPGGDCFGGFDAEFGHGLRNVFHPIQQPLGGVVVVLQKTIGLRQRRKIKNESTTLLL